jgi:hypothetical protein
LALAISVEARIETKAKLVKRETHRLHSQNILLLAVISVLNALMLMLFGYGVLPKLALEGLNA